MIGYDQRRHEQRCQRSFPDALQYCTSGVLNLLPRHYENIRNQTTPLRMGSVQRARESSIGGMGMLYAAHPTDSTALLSVFHAIARAIVVLLQRFSSRKLKFNSTFC